MLRKVSFHTISTIRLLSKRSSNHHKQQKRHRNKTQKQQSENHSHTSVKSTTPAYTMPPQKFLPSSKHQALKPTEKTQYRQPGKRIPVRSARNPLDPLPKRVKPRGQTLIKYNLPERRQRSRTPGNLRGL